MRDAGAGAWRVRGYDDMQQRVSRNTRLDRLQRDETKRMQRCECATACAHDKKTGKETYSGERVVLASLGSRTTVRRDDAWDRLRPRHGGKAVRE